jgi:hypothetical protein
VHGPCSALYYRSEGDVELGASPLAARACILNWDIDDASFPHMPPIQRALVEARAFEASQLRN